jgi:hypothetical protein
VLQTADEYLGQCHEDNTWAGKRRAPQDLTAAGYALLKTGATVEFEVAKTEIIEELDAAECTA